MSRVPVPIMNHNVLIIAFAQYLLVIILVCNINNVNSFTLLNNHDYATHTIQKHIMNTRTVHASPSSASSSSSSCLFYSNDGDNDNPRNDNEKQQQNNIPKITKIKQSAFGKAAIGIKKEIITLQKGNKNVNTSRTTSTTNSSKNDTNINNTDNNTYTDTISLKKKQKTPSIQLTKDVIHNNNNINFVNTFVSKEEQEIEYMLEQRDLALLALQQYLQLSLKQSLEILNSYPSLYTKLNNNTKNSHKSNSLASKLQYLLHDINIKPKQLKRMILSHPRLMEKVLLDSEDNITNTVEVLQSELHLSLDDIQMIQSKSLPAILSYPRSELRKRILVYKLDLLYPTNEMKKLVLKDPRVLRTNSNNVRQIVNVLCEELNVTIEDIHAMLQKETLLLTYNAEGNLRPTIRYLKEFEVGQSLGMVDRKGQSTIQAENDEDCENIMIGRLKNLIMSYPTILSSSIEKNLKPTVEFFVKDCGLTLYEFGRVIYRRGGSLLGANLDRTLKRKVSFLRDNLTLDIIGYTGFDNDMDKGDNVDGNNSDDPNVKEMQVEIPPLEQSTKQQLSTYQKRRLLAQMIATNPDILTLSIENNLQPKFDYFKNIIGWNKEEIRYVILKRPQLLSLSLERNIIPKIEYFLKPRGSSNDEGESSKGAGLGMSMEEVRVWLSHYPQTLNVAFESTMKRRIKDVIELGLHVVVDGVNNGDAVDDDESMLPLNFLTMTDKRWKAWKEHFGNSNNTSSSSE